MKAKDYSVGEFAIENLKDFLGIGVNNLLRMRVKQFSPTLIKVELPPTASLDFITFEGPADAIRLIHDAIGSVFLTMKNNPIFGGRNVFEGLDRQVLDQWMSRKLGSCKFTQMGRFDFVKYIYVDLLDPTNGMAVTNLLEMRECDLLAFVDKKYFPNSIEEAMA